MKGFKGEDKGLGPDASEKTRVSREFHGNRWPGWDDRTRR